MFTETLGGRNVQLNPSLIAGSTLLMREALEQHGAKTYAWIDTVPTPGAVYWLEDVDLNGTRTMYGPITAQSSSAAQMATLRASTLQELARPNVRPVPRIAGASLTPGITTNVKQTIAKPHATAESRQVGFELAGRPAVKILVDHEGWYRVTQPQLVAAGLNPHADARTLHLFAEGIEQPIRVMGGEGEFGPHSAIEFYGTAIDTPYSGQRVYWLASLGQPGERITTVSDNGSAGSRPSSFWQTAELKPRTTYFAALLREATDNFFGPLISPTATEQSLDVTNLAGGQGRLEVVLQGVTQGQQHDVTIAVNGSTLGDVVFVGQEEGRAQFTIPPGMLVNGNNAITLTAQEGTNDISLVDYIDLAYAHTYTAESDQLKFSASAGDTVTVAGFVHPPTRLIDVTNPQQPFEVAFEAVSQGGSYALATQVPWSSSGTHWLLALSDDQLASPVSLVAHHPSRLHSMQRGADGVILTAPQFAAQIEPLAQLREAQGRSAALISVNDVYDEFNFGEPTPHAIRDFLITASSQWKQKPHYLLLGEDASVDPRNYLGFGSLDFVPTKIVVTSELKTASDDWFSDFNNAGFAQIATGRLPARSADDAQTIVGKIIAYESGQAGTWTNQAMVVADVDDPSVSFSQAAESIEKLLPQNMNVTSVFTSTVGIDTARLEILAGIDAGQLLVNYNGHGSVEIWGNNLFTDDVASTLNNGTRLPFVVAMNCLNGFFHDMYTESLATALMLSKNGGAVAVWASSGLTEPDPQFQMDSTLIKTLFSSPGVAVGDAVLLAKSGIADQDVRKTFILFGDPAMGLKWQPSITASSVSQAVHFGTAKQQLQLSSK